MKVTLRKASALQAAVSNLIDEVRPVPCVSIEDENTVTEEVAEANEQFVGDVRRLRAMIDVKYSMRTKIAHANFTSGVSDLLTQERSQSALMGELEYVASRVDNRYYTNEQINAKFEKHEKKAALSGSSYMSRGITVTTDLITKEEVEDLRKEVLALKRARQDTNDKVLELNVSTYIVLSDDEVKLLSDEGLI